MVESRPGCGLQEWFEPKLAPFWQAQQTQCPQTPCIFFGSPQGCRYGVHCQFPHIQSNHSNGYYAQSGYAPNGHVQTGYTYPQNGYLQFLNGFTPNGHHTGYAWPMQQQQYHRQFQQPIHSVYRGQTYYDQRLVNNTETVTFTTSQVDGKSNPLHSYSHQGLSRFELYVHGFIREIAVDKRVSYDIVFLCKKYCKSPIPGLLKCIRNMDRRMEIIRDGLTHAICDMMDLEYVNAINIANLTVHCYKATQRQNELCDIFKDEQRVIPRLVDNRAKMKFTINLIVALGIPASNFELYFLLKTRLRRKFMTLVHLHGNRDMHYIHRSFQIFTVRKVSARFAGLTAPQAAEAWCDYLFDDSPDLKSPHIAVIGEEMANAVNQMAYAVNQMLEVEVEEFGTN